MAYRILMTEDAERHLQALTVRDQRNLQAAIAARLLHQPTTLTHAVKRLRPNPVAEYELRAGDLRALYDVVGEDVIISVVGLKVGNKLIVAGEEFRGHQNGDAGPSESGPDGPAD